MVADAGNTPKQDSPLSSPVRRAALVVKRGADIIIAVVGLLLAGPLTLVLAWLVRRDSPGPGVFVQRRLGRGGRPFNMYKLRTMVVNAQQMGARTGIEVGDPRVTRMGRWLRSTSLDELPQLWNILLGQMSLVGPRPLLPEHLPLWDEEQRERLLMPQGMICWVDVVGRNEIEWPRRLSLDTWYVRNWSLWLDVRTVVGVIWPVLTRRGITASDGTVPELTAETLRTDDEPADR